MTVRLRALVLSSIAVTLAPLAARADRATDTARAEALFEEGRRLMAARDFAGACPKLAESERLDPAPGTLLNLAVCYERADKTATAWATFRSAELAARRAGELDRAVAAAQKSAELTATLSRITVTVPPAARAKGLEVRCDGEPVREPTWGVALPYDPGAHEIEALAPGRRAWSMHVQLGASAQQIAVTVPALEALPPSPPPRDQAALPAALAASSGGGGQRVAGVIFAGVGALGVGVGALAGLRAKSIYAEALDACNGGTTCTSARGPSLRDDASTWATTSTIAFIAGGASLLGGALLYFTAPRERARTDGASALRAARSTPIAVGPAARGVGLSLTGRF